MNIIFLGSLICLGSSISVGDKQLSPLKKIANKSLITSAVTSSDLVKVILDHKKDPAYLLSVLSNVDPTKLNDVLLLVRALLAASEADLATVTQTSTTANTAYTDATTAYDAAVVARVDLQGTKTAFDIAFTANSALLDQQVAALLVAQTEAHGAKTNAQSTLDTETVRLNGEIETLKQVITLLESLVGSTASNSADFIDGVHNSNTCPDGYGYITTESDCRLAAENCLSESSADCKNWHYHAKLNQIENPKGCYFDGQLAGNSGKNIYFNTHVTGGYDSSFAHNLGDRPLCKLL